MNCKKRLLHAELDLWKGRIRKNNLIVTCKYLKDSDKEYERELFWIAAHDNEVKRPQAAIIDVQTGQ